MGEILSYELLNNTIQTWLSFLLTTSAALAIAYLFKRLAIARISKLAARTSFQWDDALAEGFETFQGLMQVDRYLDISDPILS